MPKRIEKRGKNSYRLTAPPSYKYDPAAKTPPQKTVKVNSYRESEREYSLFLADLQKGVFATSGKMTLNEYFDYWLDNYANCHHALKTLSFNKGLFKRISQALGQKRLDQIKPNHLLSFYSNLSEKGVRQDPNAGRRKAKLPSSYEGNNSAREALLSPNTIRKYHVLLHSLLEKAVQWQLIPFNPAGRVDPPKGQHTVKAIYDEETTGNFLLLLESEELKHRVMALLSLSTGMRRGELFGLEWKHVDLEAGTIHIEQAAQYLPEKGVFTKSTKTDGSNRIVTVPESIITLLLQYKEEQSQKQLQLVNRWQDSDRILTTWDGAPAHPDSINTWLKNFIAKHKLPPITPHSFRHMTATYLITSGTDIRTVAGKLGHSNSTTTQIVYSHLLKSAERETADKMETFLQQTTKKAKLKQETKPQ